jgi:hypothetical protein
VQPAGDSAGAVRLDWAASPSPPARA